MKDRRKEIGELIEEEYTTHAIGLPLTNKPHRPRSLYALNSLERKIYITYLEKETYADTAKVFKVSTPTLAKYIAGLKQKIMDYVFDHM